MTHTTNIAPEQFELKITPGSSIKKAMKEASAPSRDLWQYPLEKFHVMEGFNPRAETDEYKAKIRELADSMLQVGFYQHKALAGYLGIIDGVEKVCIYDGHRRFAAAKIAKAEGAPIPGLPCVIQKDGISAEDLTIALVRTNTGEPLTPYETAIVCKRMIIFGNDVKTVAKKLGFSPTHVTNLLQLMAMPSDVQNMVANKEIAATTAIEMFAEHGEKAGEVLVDATKAAKAAGKDKITNRFVPGAVFKKTLKKTSETMFQTLTEVQADPSFSSLSEETRNKLVTLVETLQKSKDND